VVNGENDASDKYSWTLVFLLSFNFFLQDLHPKQKTQTAKAELIDL